MATNHESQELTTTQRSSTTTLAQSVVDMDKDEKRDATGLEKEVDREIHSHQHPPAVPQEEDLTRQISQRVAEEMHISYELARQITDLGPPPDGGLEAWLCVLGTFFVMFCLIGVSE